MNIIIVLLIQNLCINNKLMLQIPIEHDLLHFLFLIRRDFVQNDHPAGQLADDPAEAKRNPEARRHHDELAVNDPDGEYLQGDMELAAWQAERLLKAEDTRKRRRKRKIGRVSGHDQIGDRTPN